MNAISQTEYTRMRASANSTMYDTCKIGTVSVGSSGPYRASTVTWGNATPCGFSSGESKSELAGSQTPTNKAVLRLPIGTSITETSRVQMCTIAGIALSDKPEYRVVGSPTIGPMFITACIERITTTGTG